MHQISGIIADLRNRTFFKGIITIENGRITNISERDDVPERYIMPGFIDAHIHIESSMLVPSQFARLAVQHGTVATVSDPHEIANVCGMDGINYMIEDGRKVPLKFCFGAPSCVPATVFETAGAEISVEDVKELLGRDDIYYLAEMMNWPGVLHGDAEVMAKIEAAKKTGKPVDGHAPGLKGDQASYYAKAGITTDHECFTIEEALDKIKAGMMVQIREGSAARNYEALHPLFASHPEKLMLCSDDKHPDELIPGHINEVVKRSLSLGYDIFDVLRAASLNTVEHYNLPVGLLRKDDPADFIIIDNPDDFNILETWIDGTCVFNKDGISFDAEPARIINNFTPYHIAAQDIKISSQKTEFPIIRAIDGELITEKFRANLPMSEEGEVFADPQRDILKMVVVNRYQTAEPAVAFINGFGIMNGAIASSVGHDCHNIIAVGDSDEAIVQAVNMIMDQGGGLSAVNGAKSSVLPLPVAGIMSNKDGKEVATMYEELSRMAVDMGSSLKAPYMLISFMALLVIPSLKLSDKGLFDGETFSFVDI
ncbi:MAG: adenine deaminase [Balneolia bacterium]|nr:adenine deaminase [Balneolia bacterium]